MNFRKFRGLLTLSFGLLLMATSALPAYALNYSQIATQGKVLGDSTNGFYPYPTGTLVNDSGTVYFISGTTKVPFTNWQAFIGLGYKAKNIVDGDLTNYSLASSYTINTANTTHPWGSWLIYKGTVYYSTQDGLIGVPSAQVFISNGGDWTYIVKANSYDIAALNTNPNLQLLAVNDSRITTTPTYQIPANPPSGPTNQNNNFSFSASLSSLQSPINVVAGTVNQHIASFDLSVGNAASNVILNSVGIQTASSNVAGNFQNLKVYINGSLFGTAVQNPSNNTSYTFYFQSGGVTLAPSQLTSLEVYADVSANASISQSIVSLDSTRTYVQTGDYSLTGSAITQLPTSVTGQTVQTATNAIKISTITMPNGVVGQTYAGTIGWLAQNISPSANITISISNSSALPFIPGLTLSPNGISGAPGAPIVISGLTNATGQGQLSIGGVPTQTGTYTFTVSVQENQNNTNDTKTITMNVLPATTNSNIGLSLSGGNTLSVSANNSNQIIGTFVFANNSPTDTVNLNSLTVQMANSNITGNFQNLKVFVAGVQLWASQSTATISSGSTYTFSASSPAGGVPLRINPQTSVLITVNADLPFIVNAFNSQSLLSITGITGNWQSSGQVTPQVASLAGQTVTVQGATAATQHPDSIQISNITMPNGIVGQPYVGAISWSAPNIYPTTDITAIIDRVGNTNYPYPYFPNGLTLSPNCLAGAPGSSCVFSGLRNNSNGQGQISVGGIPTQAGTYTFTVTFRESQNNTTDTRTVTMTITP